MNAFRRALTPARALLLAALLLLAQAAGLAHRVAHSGLAHRGLVSVGVAGGMAAPSTARAQAKVHTTAPTTVQATAWGFGLTNHQQAGAECRLLDQLLAHADVLPPLPLASTVLAGAHGTVADTPGSAPAALAAAYQARAPPVV